MGLAACAALGCSSPATDVTAADVSFRGTAGLTAKTVQSTLEALGGLAAGLRDDLSSQDTRVSDVESDLAALPATPGAADIAFDPTDTDLTAQDVQAALVALAGRVKASELQIKQAEADIVILQDTIAALSATGNAQATVVDALLDQLGALHPSCPEGMDEVIGTDMCIHKEPQGPLSWYDAQSVCALVRGQICTLPERLRAIQTGEFLEMTGTFGGVWELALYSGTDLLVEEPSPLPKNMQFRCCTRLSELAHLID